jgi:hypothetical protein
MAAMNAPLQGIPLRPDREAAACAERQSVIRAITAQTLACVDRRNPADVLREVWPHDVRAGQVVKAVVQPTSSADYPTWLRSAPFALLAPTAAAVKLFDLALKVNLDGATQVSIPYPSTFPQPGFIPEGGAVPAPQFTTAAITVGPARKFLIQAVLNGELRYATGGVAETVIGDVLAKAVGASLDAAVFSTTAADSTRPAGILAGTTPIVATAGGGLNAVATDLGNLAGAIATANIDPAGMVICTHPHQATTLSVLAPGFTNTVLASKQIAAGTVIGVAPAGLATAYSGTPSTEVSFESLVQLETSPVNLVGTPGSPNVISAPTRSAFQQDCFVIRVRARCAWTPFAGSVQVINSVTW